MGVKIIVAYSKQLRVIGANNMLPWSLPEDMRLFKERTAGHAVVMGRNTWESLQFAPRPLYALPGRINYVITSNPSKYDEVQAKLPPHTHLFFVTMDQMMKIIQSSKGVARRFDQGEGDYWIIGGEKVYQQFLDAGMVERVVASEVEGDHAGDAFFPQLPPDEWHPVAAHVHPGFKVWEYHRRPLRPIKEA